MQNQDSCVVIYRLYQYITSAEAATAEGGRRVNINSAVVGTKVSVMNH